LCSENTINEASAIAYGLIGTVRETAQIWNMGHQPRLGQPKADDRNDQPEDPVKDTHEKFYETRNDLC